MLEKRLIELLTRKMAGELSANELQELNDLLASYSGGVQDEELFKDIWSSKVVEEDVVPAYERHKKKFSGVLVFDEQKEEPIVSKRPLHAYKYSILACVLTLVFVVAYYFYYHQPESSYKLIIAGKGVRKLVILPDGTKVWLNADSKLSYDQNMQEGSTRLVHLSGEAFFDVAHDKLHPFIINTNKISIKVLGTAFNVKAYPNEKKCETTLIRGSVELTVNDNSKQKFVLKPSEKLALIDNKEGQDSSQSGNRGENETMLIEHINPIVIEDKEYIAETLWTENRLVFENETMKEIASKLERWYNLRIELNNQEISEYHFTGSFTNETIDQVLNAMQLIKSFNYKTNNNEVIIY